MKQIIIKPYDFQQSLIPVDGKPLTPKKDHNTNEQYTSDDSAINLSQKGTIHIPLVTDKIDDYLQYDGFSGNIKGQINIPVDGKPKTPSSLNPLINIYNYKQQLILNQFKPLSVTTNRSNKLPYTPHDAAVDDSRKGLIYITKDSKPMHPINYNDSQTVYDYKATLIPHIKQKSDLLKRAEGFRRQRPFLASFKGMLPFSLPSIPGVDTSKLLLPVYWAEIANTTWDGYLSLRKQYKLHNEQVSEINAVDMAVIAARAAARLVKIYQDDKKKQDWANQDYLDSDGRKTTPAAYSSSLYTPTRGATTMWDGDGKGHKITYDPNTFQITTNDIDIIHQNNNVPDYFKQDVIRFSIHDLNRKELMVTPAFITDLNDTGLQNEWQQIDYVNGVYPKFQYKGVSKRVVQFDLMIMCFDRAKLDVYRNKVNFLRRTGLPYYKTVLIGDKTFDYPQAPLYKLTLGSIIQDQYGFFDSCTVNSWQDDQIQWNLQQKKLWKDVNPNQEPEDNAFQFPLFSQFSIKFTCLYGVVPEQIYKYRQTNQ